MSKELNRLNRFIKRKIEPYKYNGLYIEIKSISRQDDLLCINAKAKKDNKEIFVDNPLYFKNPPTMVKDGTKRIIKDDLGNNVEINNYKENLDEAIRQMVGRTIINSNKWQH